MSIEPFIKCSDIKASFAFYTEVLDFKVVRAPDADPQSFMSMYAFLERDGSFVHLSAHAGDGVLGSVIYIREDGIDTVYHHFLQSGLKVQAVAGVSMEPVTQSWGMKEFAVTDPDGNRITFGQKCD
jgi:catechol 2,3-dioxygenase-like lactoylglutathione lyase family enzyme